MKEHHGKQRMISIGKNISISVMTKILTMFLILLFVVSSSCCFLENNSGSRVQETDGMILFPNGDNTLGNRSGSGMIDIGEYGTGSWELLDISGVVGSIIWDKKVLFHARIMNGVAYDVDMEIEVRFDSDGDDFFEMIAKFPTLKVKADKGSKINYFNVTSTRIDGLPSSMNLGNVQLALRHLSQTTPCITLMCGPDDYINVPFTPRVPVAIGGEDRTVNLNETSTFDASGSYDPNNDPLTYRWDFNASDGLEWDANGQVVTHEFNRTGTFQVTLNVSDGTYCSFDHILVEVIPPLPPMAAAGEDITAKRHENITFNGSGSNDPNNDPLSFHWDFGDGSGSDKMVIDHSYDVPDEYLVTLTVDDGTFSVNDNITVTITPNRAPIAVITIFFSPQLGVSLLFHGTNSHDPDGTGIVSFLWDFGDGGTGEGGDISHKYMTQGLKTITLTVSDGEADGARTLNITIPENQFPTAVAGEDTEQYTERIIRVDASGSTDPEGLELSYHWDFGDGNERLGKILEYSYSTSGNYKITLTVTDPFGGSDTDVQNVTIYDHDRFLPETVEVYENLSGIHGVRPRASRFYRLESTVNWTFNVTVEVIEGNNIDFLLLDRLNYELYITEFEPGESNFIDMIEIGTKLDSRSIHFEFKGKGNHYFVVDNNNKIKGGAAPGGPVEFNITMTLEYEILTTKDEQKENGTGNIDNKTIEDEEGLLEEYSRFCYLLVLVGSPLLIVSFVIFVLVYLKYQRKREKEKIELKETVGLTGLRPEGDEDIIYTNKRMNMGLFLFMSILPLFVGTALIQTLTLHLSLFAVIGIIYGVSCSICSVLYYKRIISVNNRCISISYGVGISQKIFPMDRIRSFGLQKQTLYLRYRIRRYYAWRLQTEPSLNIILRSKMINSVELKMKSGKKYTIWTDEPDELINAIRKAKGEPIPGTIMHVVRPGARDRW